MKQNHPIYGEFGHKFFKFMSEMQRAFSKKYPEYKDSIGFEISRTAMSVLVLYMMENVTSEDDFRDVLEDLIKAVKDTKREIIEEKK